MHTICVLCKCFVFKHVPVETCCARFADHLALSEISSTVNKNLWRIRRAQIPPVFVCGHELKSLGSMFQVMQTCKYVYRLHSDVNIFHFNILIWLLVTYNYHFRYNPYIYTSHGNTLQLHIISMIFKAWKPPGLVRLYPNPHRTGPQWSTAKEWKVEVICVAMNFG